MKGLAALVVSLFDLFEAEGRLLQENILVTVQRGVTLALGLMFGAAALAFLIAAAFSVLTIYLSAPLAFLIMALLCGAICGVLLLWVKRKKTTGSRKGRAKGPKAESRRERP